MVSVLVSGTDGRTGPRLVARLKASAAVGRVVVLDEGLSGDGLTAALTGVDAVVHVGAARSVGALLSAFPAASGPALVYRSSAAVYGAWADNRVPLTEEVPLRPNPAFSFAIEHAEAERLVAEWRDAHPQATAAVLRLAPVVAPGGESWESSTLGRPSSLRRREGLPPAQFLHVDDAAAALAHAVANRLDGTFNVAPDGSVPGETARALATAGLTLPLPDRLASLAERWAWRLGWGGAPGPAVPYLVHPWVVANDRLRATGWSPEHTNEEALVAARKGSWWRELSPKRRQEVALGFAGAVGVGSAAAAVLVVRRARSRRPAA